MSTTTALKPSGTYTSTGYDVTLTWTRTSTGSASRVGTTYDVHANGVLVARLRREGSSAWSGISSSRAEGGWRRGNTSQQPWMGSLRDVAICYGLMGYQDGVLATDEAKARTAAFVAATPAPTTTTTVVAEDAPLGVLLWPVLSPEFEPNYTLDRVTVVRTTGGTHVEWTYQSGKTRTFDLGEHVVVNRL